MPPPTLDAIALYILLHLRGALPGFHWSLFLPTTATTGTQHHATNRTGSWHVESRPEDLSISIGLCVALKLCTVADEKRVLLEETLGGVDGSDQPSARTGEMFSCRVWVTDALCALHEAGAIRLAGGGAGGVVDAVEAIEKRALEAGEEQRGAVERGTGGVRVVDAMECVMTA